MLEAPSALGNQSTWFRYLCMFIYWFEKVGGGTTVMFWMTPLWSVSAGLEFGSEYN